jgi:hypothetical protein
MKHRPTAGYRLDETMRKFTDIMRMNTFTISTQPNAFTFIFPYLV